MWKYSSDNETKLCFLSQTFRLECEIEDCEACHNLSYIKALVGALRGTGDGTLVEGFGMAVIA